MNQDAELAAWRRHWQAKSEANDMPDLARLKEQVLRQSRRIRIGLIAPSLVTVGIGGHLISQAMRSGRLTDIVLAMEGWIFIIVVWAACLWVARGTWRPFGQTTAAFVDLAIRRCQSNLTATRLGMWFYCVQLVSVSLLVWAIETSPARLVMLLTSWPVILLGWIGLPTYMVWMAWFLGRRRAELARLLDLKRQLAEA
jgi:hypothetical protein